MRLSYLYHSGFVLETNSAYVVFDLFLDGNRDYKNNPQLSGLVPTFNLISVPNSIVPERYGLSEPLVSDQGVLAALVTRCDKPIYFLVSHNHDDHFQREILSLFCAYREQYGEDLCKRMLKLVVSRDCVVKFKKLFAAKQVEPIVLRCGENYQDECVHILAFGSTDLGVSYGVKLDGITVFHAGDLNNWHWQDESTQEEIAAAERDYRRELNVIKEQQEQLGVVDMVMYPIDPRMEHNYALGMQQWLELIPSKVVVAMHMWERTSEVVQELRALGYEVKTFEELEGTSLKLSEVKSLCVVPQFSGEGLEFAV